MRRVTADGSEACSGKSLPRSKRGQGARNMAAPSVVIRHSGRSGFRPFGTSCLCLASSAQSAEESKTMATRRELLGVTVLAGASPLRCGPGVRRPTGPRPSRSPTATPHGGQSSVPQPITFCGSKALGCPSPAHWTARHGEGSIIVPVARSPCFRRRRSMTATPDDRASGGHWRMRWGKIATRVSGWLGPKFTVPDAVVISAMSSRMYRHPQGCATA